LVVVASGFLNPANNSNGAAFGLWAAKAAGGALVELPNVTSVSDMVIDGNFLMYPNPTSGDVNLQSAHMIREVKVIDITGRTVYANSVEANDYRINTRGFNSGIYFVQIVTSEGTIVTKLQVKK
ncbi:MAG: T9SS type A sorting domain-containing protein, partial [Bacteroidales bacterium]